ncbi:nucleoside diphosphate-linked moiety X motif 17 isoform X3 [Cuculus canorus]|uniref:nucleoside diphosphate-linked moiety X motif 17 isoform X3 n=1 Tax=Cuculus canorus TaxID=55661 RepID=UPI0023AA7AF5|nr:nucleoside diphosphate-linked moiety X motif 17 isoform X3 [Cuculus canorus]
MAAPARVLVHVRRGSAEGAAPFGKSVTGAFCPAHEDAAVVNYALRRHRFLLSDEAFPGSAAALLQRPPFCPAKRLGQRGERPAAAPGAPGVAVAVATILQAGTGRILLTRRARGLSAFPGLWVPPGGVMEPGEELLCTGLRELQEETGLQLRGSAFTWRVLCLWESVFPPVLSWGSLRRHHLVVYLLLRCAESHCRLQARMCPNESEVSAYAWLEPRVSAAIAATEDGAKTSGVENSGRILSEVPASIRITELSGGSTTSVRIPTRFLLRTIPEEGDDVERVSSGTKAALRLWRDSLGKQE